MAVPRGRWKSRMRETIAGVRGAVATRLDAASGSEGLFGEAPSVARALAMGVALRSVQEIGSSRGLSRLWPRRAEGVRRHRRGSAPGGRRLAPAPAL